MGGRIAARSGLVLAGLLLAFVVCEAGLRVAGPRVPGIADLTTIATFQTYHPTFGFFHRPGATAWIHTSEFTSFVQINSRGLRDREIPYEKPAAVRRVLLLGDSIVEGSQVPLEQTIAKRLEARIQLAGTVNVQVINAGNAGFGTAQELLFLEQEGVRYAPDVVVLVYYVDNDVADNGYALSLERKLDVRRRPFFVPDGSGGLKLLPIVAPASDAWEGAKSTARSWSMLYGIGETVALREQQRDQENQQIGKNRPTYLIEPPAEWQESWWVTERLIPRVRDAAERMGARFVLVVAPANYQVSDEAWRSLMGGEAADRARRYDREVPNRRIQAVTAAAGIATLDLLPAMRAVPAASDVYFPEDGHWTAAGHDLAAAELYRYLVGLGALR
ncbi:MAG: SGNH/GDSL hydrolase family protein [Chloroflexota bacterium]